MKTLLRRMAAAAGLALSAVVVAGVLGRTAFRGDVQTLLAGPSGVETKVVSEEMLDDLPAPVQRYLRYTVWSASRLFEQCTSGRGARCSSVPGNRGSR